MAGWDGQYTDLLVVPYSQSWLRLRGDAGRVVYLESLVPGTVGKLEKGNMCEGVRGVGPNGHNEGGVPGNTPYGL